MVWMANRAQWARRVSEWRESGLTAEKFANRRGLRLRSLYEWSSLLGREAGVVRGGLAVQPSVVEVVGLGTAFQGAAIAAAFEVTLPSGVRVGVPAGFATDDLRRLLAVLGVS